MNTPDVLQPLNLGAHIFYNMHMHKYQRLFHLV